MIMGIVLIKLAISTIWVKLLLSVITGGIIYGIMLFIFNNPVAVDLLGKVRLFITKLEKN